MPYARPDWCRGHDPGERRGGSPVTIREKLHLAGVQESLHQRVLARLFQEEPVIRLVLLVGEDRGDMDYVVLAVLHGEDVHYPVPRSLEVASVHRDNLHICEKDRVFGSLLRRNNEGVMSGFRGNRKHGCDEFPISTPSTYLLGLCIGADMFDIIGRFTLFGISIPGSDMRAHIPKLPLFGFSGKHALT